MKPNRLRAAAELRQNATAEEVGEILITRNAEMIEAFRHLQRAGQSVSFYALTEIVIDKGLHIKAHLVAFGEDKSTSTDDPEEANEYRVHYTSGYDQSGHQVAPISRTSERFSLLDERQIKWLRNGSYDADIDMQLMEANYTLKMLTEAMMDEERNPDIAPGVKAYFESLQPEQAEAPRAR